MLNADEYAQLTAEERAIYDAASDEEGAKFAVEWRAKMARPEGEVGATAEPKSMMRTFGRVCTPLSLVVSIFLSLVAASEGGPYGLWALAFSSLFGLGSLAWMLGAIEVRLIKIDETLKSRERVGH